MHPKFTRRRMVSATMMALTASPLWAQSTAYPSKPIKIVVPSPPGGSTDLLARLAGQWLQEAWGQSVVIENKPGAGLRLGAEFVAKSPADGYTLLMGAVHHSIAQAVYTKRSYEFQRDLAPITVVGVVPNVVIVPADLPAKSVADLMALAKAQPGKLSYGSTGQGTAHHLIGEQFADMAGVELLHVPYKGSAPALVDLIGGQIQLMFDTLASCLPHIKSGKVRALAVTTAKRASSLPDVPTLHETSLKDFDVSSWFGLMAPAGTPQDIIRKIHEEVAKKMATPATRQHMVQMGTEPGGNSPEQLRRQIDAEVTRFAALAQKLKLKLD